VNVVHGEVEGAIDDTGVPARRDRNDEKQKLTTSLRWPESLQGARAIATTPHRTAAKRTRLATPAGSGMVVAASCCALLLCFRVSAACELWQRCLYIAFAVLARVVLLLCFRVFGFLLGVLCHLRNRSISCRNLYIT
jgi:hypothetical protein